MKQEKQKIELTKEQFLTLMKVVYLGNWMANANRTGGKDDPNVKEYEEISDYIFSLASRFDLEKYISHEAEDGDKYFLTNEFEEKTDVKRLHEDYDEETFWDELPERLGERDFYRMYSKEDWKKMTRDERFIKLQECIIKWEEEVDNNGIEKLEIVDRKNIS